MIPLVEHQTHDFSYHLLALWREELGLLREIEGVQIDLIRLGERLRVGSVGGCFDVDHGLEFQSEEKGKVLAIGVPGSVDSR